MESTNLNHCQNCNTAVAEGSLYCANCGQRTEHPKVPIWSVITDFLYDQLNLDTRLYYALGKIWYPGKLTDLYFKGKRKTQSNPFRLFLIFAAIALTLFNLVHLRNWDEAEVNLFETDEVFVNINEYNEAIQKVDQLLNGADSLASDQIAWKDSVNTLLRLNNETVEIPNLIGDGLSENSSIYVQTRDYYGMSPKEIALKYASNYSPIERYILQQEIKVLRNSDNLIPFMMSNIIWILFTQIIASALILKLIYLRRKRYLVEHIVFSLHYQAFALLLTIIGILTYNTFNAIAGILGILLAIYIFLAMKFYYGQNHIKTLIKYILYLTFTFMAFTILMSIGQMLSFLFF